MNDIRGNFEYAYFHGDGLLVVGWCSSINDAKDELSIILGLAECEEHIKFNSCVRFPRPDVASALGIEGGDNHNYGFVASLPLDKKITNIEFIGANLCLEIEEGHLDELEMAILIPEKESFEEIMHASWSIWYNVLKEASHTPAMQRAYENLLTRFGEVGPEVKSATYLRMAFDLCARVSDDSIMIVGWALSLDHKQALLDIRASNSKDSSESLSLLDHLSWIDRADVIDHFGLPSSQSKKVGFLCFVSNFQAEQHVMLKALSAEGAEIQIVEPLVDLRAKPFILSQHLFQLFSLQEDNLRMLLDKQIGPAMQSSWSTYRQAGMLSTPSVKVKRFGPALKTIQASIIIPLYKRYDFLEYQLSQFALDPFMQDVEILYVNDDPDIQAPLLTLCHALQPIYGLTFSVVHADKNLGYAGANNLGASVAKSDTLLLLNSDVMPKETSWLKQMLDAYKSKQDIGAMGVRLLYEDGSLQHDGMMYNRFPFLGNMWICEHPSKGLSPWVRPSTDKLTTVEAVTGACLMVSTQRYKEVGGLDKTYIQGDFEDSDLCLKLRLKGYTNYLLSKVELYHLERQSQSLAAPDDWKAKLTAYNCWQHNQRWDKVLTKLKRVDNVRKS